MFYGLQLKREFKFSQTSTNVQKEKKTVVNESNDDSFALAKRPKGRSCLSPFQFLHFFILSLPNSSTSPLFRWVNKRIISANVADTNNI